MSRKNFEDINNVSLLENVDMSVGYKGGMPVNVKNNGTESVLLSVHMASAPSGEFIQTTFFVGWNPEIVDAIEANSAINNIQIGM